MPELIQHHSINRISPDREVLQRQLVALLTQYDNDIAIARSIELEHAQLIQEARRERRSAAIRSKRLKRLLDEEFPGWDEPALTA